jgi:selenocysteine lyase/cysteine desulfurase
VGGRCAERYNVGMVTSRSSLAPKSDFIGLEGVAHLAAGGETPFLRSHLDAFAAYARDKSAGLPGRERFFAVKQEARARLARLLGCTPGDLAFLSSTSEGINLVAGSLDWRPGDNVVLEAHEFPSDLHPWQRLRARGVEVRLLRPPALGGPPGPEPWSVLPERFEEAVDERTRVVALSVVSYFTGERHDLERIAAIARRRGALLLADASHALGVVPVRADQCDFLFACSYKFLLAHEGVAVFYWNRARWPDWEPPTVGWHSVVARPPAERLDGYVLKPDAERAEAGNPPFPGIYVLNNALGYLLALGIERIEEHVLALGATLRAGLVELGLDVLTPAEPARRAANVAFSTAEGPRLERALYERGVYVWEADGRVRLSLHAYNDESDVERALAALRAALGR